MSKRLRQYAGILAAILSYYLIHEGAHFLYAVQTGTLRAIKFMGIGVQIDVYRQGMSDIQVGIFCFAGAAATFICGWGLIIFAGKICRMKSQVIRAVLYYVTLAMLFIDPVYLGVLCGFFGGGDMNGIRLLVPEGIARISFLMIGLLHMYVFLKRILPLYRASFQVSQKPG